MSGLRILVATVALLAAPATLTQAHQEEDPTTSTSIDEQQPEAAEEATTDAPETPETPEGIDESWPIGGALGQRIYCIEEIESTHGAHMYNRVDIRGVLDGRAEHAQGWLGWLPSTAATWGARIGNRTSEWFAARRMFTELTPRQMGRQFYGVGAGIC